MVPSSYDFLLHKILLEHRKTKNSLETPIKFYKTVALCINAYQEDPDYLWKCLQSVKRLTYPGIKVVMVTDGNSDDDLYMMDIFSEVMGRDKSATYIWRNNVQEKGPDHIIQKRNSNYPFG
ncbi:Hyaluronan synthase 2 [Fukomys damarensis]|uniref:Hyaluronan synthase 2 n=1 Tax=Fukomys damarensis TaxID=885580 RepID=A0A091E3S9_FUKDA|nr:Hyaluronan synthase 2 [Fukomys damarensis]